MENRRRFETTRRESQDTQGEPRAVTRVAVVGLGYWGPNLLRALFELPDVEVSYACDLDPARRQRIVRRYPSVIETARLDDVLEDDEVDAVVLATPVFTHYELGMRTLQAGKHVFIEKPLAGSSVQADELIETANDRDRVLMCGHTFIYSPAVRWVKQLIASGELGEIHYISSSRVNLGLHQRDVSVVWDLAPHDFSILLYWMAESPEWVRAIGRDAIVKGVPDVAFIDLAFPSGTLAHVELSWLAPSKLRRTLIVGSEKMVVYDDTSPEPVRIFDSGVTYRDPETFGQYHLSYRTGDILSPHLETLEPIAVQLKEFIDGVRAHTSPQGNRELARDVVRLMEATDQSMSNHGSAVTLAQPARVRGAE